MNPSASSHFNLFTDVPPYFVRSWNNRWSFLVNTYRFSRWWGWRLKIFPPKHVSSLISPHFELTPKRASQSPLIAPLMHHTDFQVPISISTGFTELSKLTNRNFRYIEKNISISFSYNQQKNIYYFIIDLIFFLF